MPPLSLTQTHGNHRFVFLVEPSLRSRCCVWRSSNVPTTVQDISCCRRARWVVERTFSWFGRNRRLAKDYENLADTLAAFILKRCILRSRRRVG